MGVRQSQHDLHSRADGSVGRHRAGLSALYVVVILVALIGFVSMAVDVGRVRLARTQLQTATDAAARAAADSLPISTQTVLDNATEAAESNKLIDADSGNHERTNPGLELQTDEDVVFGAWDPDDRRFTAIEDTGGTARDDRRGANAMQVVGRRIHQRGNAVPLIFAPVVGVFSSDLERNATAYISGGPANFGFIGLNSVTANNATIDSMVYGQAGTGGGVASDGNISLGSSDVYGDARAGRGRRLTGGDTVTGWAANLDYALAPKFPDAGTPPGTPAFNPPGNGNWNLPPTGTSASFNPQNPRTYRVNGIALNNRRSIRVTGYVTLYVEGDITAGANNAMSNTDGAPTPARLNIVVVGQRSVTLGGNARQYAHVYAPDSSVTVRGSAGFYGWMIGRTLRLQSGSRLHYDETRNEEKNYKITLVR